MPKLSVIIPVYNERETIEKIVRLVDAVEIDKEIIIVDDMSDDGTRLILRHLAAGLRSSLRVLLHQQHRGKGAAVRRGFAEAVGDIVLIQDADLELDPGDYHSLIRPIQRRRSDVVFGSRFQNGRPEGTRLVNYIGNRILTQLSNGLNGLQLTDVWTCYKVFSREVAQSLNLREDGFSFEPEVTAEIARAGWRICEVPVSYYPRNRSMGKKIDIMDGLMGALATIRYNLCR